MARRRTYQSAEPKSKQAVREEMAAEPAPSEYLDMEQVADDPGTWAPAPPSSPSISGPSYRSTANPVDAAQGQRDMIQWQGQKLDQDAQDDYWRAAGMERDYAGQIDPYAREMVEGRGGYTDEEKARIYQDGREGENFMTPEEQLAAGGNTDSWGNYFSPEAMSGAQQESAALQRGAAQRMTANVGAAVNPDQLRQSEGYRARSGQSLKDNRANTWNTVIGNAENVRGAIGETGENVRGAIDPSAVTTSDAFLQDYALSPEKQQDMVESAGISAGTGYRAATGELQRRALAAGSNPQGVAAYRARMERAAAGDAADAMTKARVAASQEEARRKMAGEELRTQGGRYLTDTRVGSEMELGRQRSGAEERMGSQAIDTQRRLGENETAQINTEEDSRLGAERYLTDASTRAAQIGGQAELDTEGNINSQQRQQMQYNTGMGTDIARGQDTASSDRAYRAATNRQGVSMANQTNASNRAATVGNARMGQQQVGMGTLQQQGQTQNQNAQNARQRQQQTYGTQTSGTNQATAIGAAADNANKSRPGIFDKIVGGVTGAVGALGGGEGMKAIGLADGGVVTKPTYALIGEDGPEAVVPLGGYRARAKTRPSLAMGKEQARRPRFYGQAA